MYQYRVETYYRNDIIFKIEDVFFEETLSLEIPRFVNNVLEKSYKNTVDLLNYCVQFAVSGTVRAWLIDSGEILSFDLLEPDSDKAVVQSFIKGRALVKQSQEEAMEELNRAIEHHDRHAQAYERRAKTNFLLRNYHEAIRDYSKSIGIDPTVPSAYFGRARVQLMNKNYEAAIADFDQAVKKSVALESIHWRARRLKGLCHMDLKQYTKAIFELKLFTHRKFKDGDPNQVWKRESFYKYGVALFEIEDYIEALAAFNQALDMTPQNDTIETSELLRFRGLCKKKSGKNGYVKDIKEAAKLGDSMASLLLKEM